MDAGMIGRAGKGAGRAIGACLQANSGPIRLESHGRCRGQCSHCFNVQGDVKRLGTLRGGRRQVCVGFRLHPWKLRDPDPRATITGCTINVMPGPQTRGNIDVGAARGSRTQDQFHFQDQLVPYAVHGDP